MKKRIMGILLCICMMFILLPMTAMAAYNDLIVAGTNVVNGNNITYWLCDNGSITGAGASENNYNVKYDPTTNTLTLNNANIAVSEDHAIYDSSPINSLTILLIGNNTVKSTADSVAGIYCQRYLKITAQEESASLNVSGTRYGIQCGSTTEISGKATITVMGNDCALCSNRHKTVGAFKVYAGLDAGRATSVDTLEEINHDFDYPYARIEPVTDFTVTFDANGGSGTMDPQVFTNAQKELTANAFTREYYAFAGWNTQSDGSGYSYLDKEWVEFNEPGEVTLYAQWQPFLYVAGVQVTGANAADVLGDGKVKYDPTTNTLTLNGATVTGDNAAEKKEGIYANGDLNIILQGENTVTASATGANAVITVGSLTLEGTGTLNATCFGYCIQAHGGDIAISNVTVNAAGVGNHNRGIVAFSNAGSGGDITISSGTVTAEGEKYGICASNSITISSGTVTADASTTRNGIITYGIYGDNITISDSTVTATAVSPHQSYGIISSEYINGFIAITDSTVTAKGTNALNKAPLFGDPADWYQWTTTENGAMTKSTDTPYPYDENHTYLKIEPIPAPTVAVDSVTVAPATLTLTEGDSRTLTATVAPDNAANKTVIWTSSNPAVATVDANGKVTAVAAGTATITATTEDGGKTATCAVTVSHNFTARTQSAETLKTAGNCRDYAVYYYSCSVCGQVENNDSHTFNGDKVPGTHVGGTRVEGDSEPDHKTQTAGSTGNTICNGCGTTLAPAQPIQPDAHTPANVWSNDEAYHWKECTVVGCGIVIDGSKATHSSDKAENKATCQKAAVCDVCGVSYGSVAAHDWNTSAWEKDATGHWHTCNTPGCTGRDAFATHTPDHQGGATEEYAIKCTICRFEIEAQLGHTHVFDKEVVAEQYKVSGATCTEPAKYYKSCRCGEKGSEPFSSGIALGHTEGTAWEKDATGHWHICTAAGCGVVIDSSMATHTPDRDAATETDPIQCSVCGYEITPALGHAHAHSTAWKSDNDNHWNECACGDKANTAAHKDENTDGKCDVCAYNVGVPTPPADPSKPDNPQTGDNSMMWLWIALMFVGGFGVVTTTLLGKKRSFTK